mgnify:CR=1 FL=1
MLVAFLDEYRCAENFAAEYFNCWSEASDQACVKGGLLAIQQREAFHAQLLEIGDDGQPAILAGLGEFQEHLGGELTITLLAGLGRGHDVHKIDETLMTAAIDWLREEANRHAAA